MERFCYYPSYLRLRDGVGSESRLILSSVVLIVCGLFLREGAGHMKEEAQSFTNGKTSCRFEVSLSPQSILC